MFDPESLPPALENVTFVQLRIFAYAALTGSFAKAAEFLEISPPAVSGQVKTLEQRLGHTLFRRRKGATPVLTTDGEEVLECVAKIFTAGRRCSGAGRPDGRRRRWSASAQAPSCASIISNG